MMGDSSRNRRSLEIVKISVTPEVFAQISTRLQDIVHENNNGNQNMNDGLSEEMANLKPAVLRAIVFAGQSDDLTDNQNQNQGRLAELEKFKPQLLRQLRLTLRGDDAMDNQNQNQGSIQDRVRKPLLKGQ